MSEIKMVIKGMRPMESTKEDVEHILVPLKYLLPPESDIKIMINKYNKGFEGVVTVRSSLGDFTASETHKDIIGLTKSLRDIMKSQIFKCRQTHHSWKKVS